MVLRASRHGLCSGTSTNGDGAVCPLQSREWVYRPGLAGVLGTVRRHVCHYLVETVSNLHQTP